MSDPVKAVMNGAGSRGMYAYGKYAEDNPDRLDFIAVAEPDDYKRKDFQKRHNIPDNKAFSSWEEMMNEDVGKLAEVAFICTPDLLHYEPAMRALGLDYNLVLEKPIAPKIKQCREIEQLAKQKKKFVQVCHVLRYTDFWKKVKEIVDSGEIGKIIHYEHSENVSFWHFAHSYVRGPFCHTDHSAPFILAKTCHDLDLMYWIMGEKSRNVKATGGLTHYCEENAPEGAPERCIDGCPVSDSCPWYAPRFYIRALPFLQIGTHSHNRFVRFFSKLLLKSKGLLKFLSVFIPPLKNFINWQHWPATVMTNDTSLEGKRKALRETPYGKCVYHSHNNQPDHIVSTYEFPNGKVASLISTGLSDLEGRELRIFGTKGTIRGYFRYNGEKLWVRDLRHTKTRIIHESGIHIEGHGGADRAMMDSFTSFMLGEAKPGDVGYTDITEAMESHYMGFASEEAREKQKALKMDQFRGKSE